jgi:hypothetical protein
MSEEQAYGSADALALKQVEARRRVEDVAREYGRLQAANGLGQEMGSEECEATHVEEARLCCRAPTLFLLRNR